MKKNLVLLLIIGATGISVSESIWCMKRVRDEEQEKALAQESGNEAQRTKDTETESNETQELDDISSHDGWHFNRQRQNTRLPKDSGFRVEIRSIGDGNAAATVTPIDGYSYPSFGRGYTVSNNEKKPLLSGESIVLVVPAQNQPAQPAQQQGPATLTLHNGAPTQTVVCTTNAGISLEDLVAMSTHAYNQWVLGQAASLAEEQTARRNKKLFFED